MKSDNIKWPQAELNLAMRFLDFLDSILLADLNPLKED
jgi:hypothetical protein